MVSENVIVYKIAPWECPAGTNLFQKVKNEHFLTLIWMGFLEVRFEMGGKTTPCLKPVRIMLET